MSISTPNPGLNESWLDENSPNFQYSPISQRNENEQTINNFQHSTLTQCQISDQFAITQASAINSQEDQLFDQNSIVFESINQYFRSQATSTPQIISPISINTEPFEPLINSESLQPVSQFLQDKSPKIQCISSLNEIETLEQFDTKTFQPDLTHLSDSPIDVYSMPVEENTKHDFPETNETKHQIVIMDLQNRLIKEFEKSLTASSPEGELGSIWDAQRSKLETEAEFRASRECHRLIQEDSTLERTIQEQLKDHIELYERAQIIKKMFDHEIEKWKRHFSAHQLPHNRPFFCSRCQTEQRLEQQLELQQMLEAAELDTGLDKFCGKIHSGEDLESINKKRSLDSETLTDFQSFTNQLLLTPKKRVRFSIPQQVDSKGQQKQTKTKPTIKTDSETEQSEVVFSQ